MNRVVTIFLSALLTLAVGLTPATPALAKSPRCPKLKIDPEKIDFRNIPLDEPGARSVLITNTSETESADILTISAEPNPPFEVEQATITCKGELAPKKSCGVNILCSPTAERKFKGHATITINGCKAEEIKLTCNGSAPVGPTRTATATPTKTATATPTRTATATATLTSTATASATPTASSTATRGSTASITATATISATATSTPSATATPTATATPGPALFVTISGSSVMGAAGSVAAYLLPLGADPNIPPSGSFTGTSFSGPVGIGLDAGGNIYVANGSSSTITAYPPGSNGDVTPSSSIGGANTTLLFPSLLTINSSNIYVANTGGGTCNGAVTVFPTSGNGNVAPSGSIVCASVANDNTQLVHPNAVALDDEGNIFVTNSSSPSVTIYLKNSSGNVAPIASIQGGNRLCSDVGIPFACCSGPQSGTCTDMTQLGSPYGITLDSKDNIYVTNQGGPPGAPGSSVTIYPPVGANTGFLNEAPTATIAGANTLLNIPAGIVLDSKGNIYVANLEAGESNNITVYPPLGSSTGTLNEAPIATINTAPSIPGNPLGLAIGQFTPPK